MYEINLCPRMDLCVPQVIIYLKYLDEEVKNDDTPPNHRYDEQYQDYPLGWTSLSLT